MKITNKMIHPQLRLRGLLFRTLLRGYSKGTLRFLGNISRHLGRRRSAKTKDMRIEQVYIDSCGHRMRLSIYRPLTESDNLPGLLWIHGGGYALGFPEQDEKFIRRFMRTVPCVIVSPAYRLSSEAPYPAALDDCCSALVWMKEHAGEYGIRDDRLMVGGDSAGGGLTAAVSIRARDEGTVAISCQMPLYPMLDDRTGIDTFRDNDAPVWNSRSNRNAWAMYLGSLNGQENIPATAAPARLADFTGLPPTFTFVGSIEPFHDETVAYMENLRAAGVPVEYHVYEGCYHAFDMMCPSSEPSKEATAALLDYFRGACENYSAPQPGNQSTPGV